MLENPLIVLVDTYEINHYLGFNESYYRFFMELELGGNLWLIFRVSQIR